MEKLTEIDLFDKLHPGDRVRMRIRSRSLFGDTIGSYITAAAISRVENDPRFIIDGWDYDNDSSVTLRIRVIDPGPQVVQAGISPWLIALAIVGVSIAFLSVTTYKVSDVVEEVITGDNPNAADIASGFKLVSIASVLLGLYFVLRKA